MRRLVLALSLFLLGGINCTKPTGPVSTKGSILYVITDRYPDGNSRVFFVDTRIDSLVDSLLIPYLIYGLGVSPDGSILYLGIPGLPFNGLEIDTRTKTTRYFGPNTGIPTPDGKYLIYSDAISKIFNIFDSRTHKILFSSNSLAMSIPSTGRPFDRRKNLVYGVVFDSTQNSFRKIGAFNYRNFKLEKVITPAQIGAPDIAVVDLVVTNSGRKLYYTSSGYTPYFIGIDLDLKKVEVVKPLNWLSYLAITPDDRYIYHTDAVGPIIIGPCGTGEIGVYSPNLEKSIEPVDVDKAWCEGIVKGCSPDIYCPTGPCGAATHNIVISPNGKKAYISDALGCTVLILDTQKNEIVGEVLVSSEPTFMESIVIQPPKQFNLK